MTIKTKLTLNIIVVLAMIVAVSVTSIIGMTFVSNKLSYLTERSTPFQMRTVELQRALAAASAALIKVGGASSQQELQAARSDTERALAEVKGAEDALVKLSSKDGSNRVSAEMRSHADELLEIITVKIRAEEDATASNRTISQQIQASASNMKDLDLSIKSMLRNTQGAFASSMLSSSKITQTLREIEELRSSLKDLQFGVSDLIRNLELKGKQLIIARGKVSSNLQKAMQNPYLIQNQKLGDDIKAIKGKLDNYLAIRQKATAEEPKPAGMEEMGRDVSESISVLLLSVEQEVATGSEKYTTETRRQEGAYSQSSLANTVLMGNSALGMLGLTVNELSTRLFTNITIKECDTIADHLSAAFADIAKERKELEAGLRQLSAESELKKLASVDGSLMGVNKLIFAGDGVLAKIRNRIVMQEKVTAATEAVRHLVAQQSAQGQITVGTARGEQEKAITEVSSVIRSSSALILVISILSVLVGNFFGYWVYRSISKPLGQLISMADRIAHGDLRDAEVGRSASRDEIGQVQSSMFSMTGSLKNIAGQITDATNTLAASSEELSATATLLESGTDQQTAQVEQSAAAMTRISRTITEVSKTASETSDTAQAMKKTASTGKEKVDSALGNLRRFADQINVSAEKIADLERRSNEIRGIVDLIRQVADQTNLLALNAAIEAARAGEKGRGFSVVAAEVRKLAERTAEATNSIAATIQAMGGEITESVTMLQQEREEAGQILAEVGMALTSIDEIVHAAERVASMIGHIAASTEEQSASSVEVSQGMENIAEIARDLKHSVHEIKSTSDGLADHASDLNVMAAWFKMS
ncbi:MAG: HAMP domain-containing protein [Desulfobulbaceae bacterium]|nr:HAMP domain-containing protein [Desulfobulbaceae bacterium]